MPDCGSKRAPKFSQTLPAELLFITRKWAPAVGGMETYCIQLVERLREKRHLELVALPGRTNGRSPSILSLLTFGATTFVRLLLRRSAHIVHVADMASWPLAWAAKLGSFRAAIVLSAHGTDLSYASRPGWRATAYGAYLQLGAKLLPRAHIIANSSWVAGLARESGFANVSIVHMGTTFAPPATPLKTNGSLLFAGRILRGKGLRFLVEEVLPALRTPIKLRVAGPIWDEEEARYLSSPNVEWLGSLSPTRLAQEYASATVVTVPSILPEGFGLVAAEAAAAGGVVVAADHSGLAEAVTPETGFLVPSRDPYAWALRIDDIRGWSELKRQRFIARSTEAARQCYSWEQSAAETDAIYLRLNELLQ